MLGRISSGVASHCFWHFHLWNVNRGSWIVLVIWPVAGKEDLETKVLFKLTLEQLDKNYFSSFSVAKVFLLFCSIQQQRGNMVLLYRLCISLCATGCTYETSSHRQYSVHFSAGSPYLLARPLLSFCPVPCLCANSTRQTSPPLVVYNFWWFMTLTIKLPQWFALAWSLHFLLFHMLLLTEIPISELSLRKNFSDNILYQ